MATPVPYEGAPTQAPGFNPTPSIGVQTSPEAFGTNVAEAAGHLGQIVEGSGKELFDRAYAMQDLQLHADVNARLSDALNKSQNLFVDYSNLEGKKAVDALPEYQSQLDKVRVAGGDGLSPVGQEYYDTESRNARNRLGFLGASHAVGEQKRFVNGAADASISSSMKMMEIDPKDPATTESALKNIRDQVAHKFGDIGGMSTEEVKVKQSDAVNAAVQGRVRALAKDDPIGAQALFDNATKDGDIYGNDALNLSWYIRNQRDNIGSRQVADQTFSAMRNTGGPVLRALFKNESGGSLTVENPQGTTSGHAQGAFQITTGTWHEFAGRAGIDLADYPDAKSAPYAVQAQMANVIPLKRWDHTTLEAMERAGGKLDPSKTLGENLRANGEGLGPGAGQKDPPLADLVSHGRALAQSQFPNDPTFPDIVEDKIITQYNKERSIQRDTDFQNDQTLAGALIGGVGKDKQLPTSVDQLKQDPQAAQAWDALQSSHPSELQKYLRQMASNAKGDVAMTPDRLNNWQTLNGQAVNDPEGFMKATQDLSTVDLPRAEKMQIIKMQQAIYKKQDANPQVGHALSLLNQTGVLTAAGLTKDQDPDSLHLFTGVLHDAMTQYNEQNGKPMDDQTIKDTAQQLLTSVSGQHFWNSSKPWFQSVDSVPPEAAAAISDEFQKRNVMPSESAILQAYIAAQYQEIYGKTKAPKP